MNTKFSLNDVEVVKSNDEFTNGEMSKIFGGFATMSCTCYCGTNSTAKGQSQSHEVVDQT